MPLTRSVAGTLSKLIERSGRSQREIGNEAGFANPNIISMMKKGQTKVPVEKAPALARALNVDPSYLVRLVLREYQPETWRAIEGALGEVLTANERRLLEIYRETCRGSEVPVDEKRQAAVRAALREP